MNNRVKAIIWGVGGKGNDFLREKIRNYKYEIVCFTDSNPNSWGQKMHGDYQIINLENINEFDYDVIIICSQYDEEIRKRLVNELKIESNLIISYRDIEAQICDSIIEKYQNSEEVEMNKTLEFYKKGSLGYFGSYNPPYEKYSTVYRDEDYPYILFEDKKCIFPQIILL